MQRTDTWTMAVTMLGLALAGCAATVDPEPDFEAARAQVRASTGLDAPFDPDAPLLSDAQLRERLADGLTLDEALALALLNNRRLQAGWHELGVGRAELVQAGLIENPRLSLAFLWPSGGGAERFGADLLGSVAELWQLRRREKLERLNQDRRILDLSRLAGELVLATEAAYLETVFAEQARRVAQSRRALAETMLASVRRQVELGVATKVDEDLAHGRALEAELELRGQAEAASIGKQRLAALLSVDTRSDALLLTSPAPESSSLDSSEADLLARAAQSRLDLKAARTEVEAAQARVRLEQRRRFPAAAAGVTTERPEVGSSTSFVGGVAAEIELPLFDQNQAQLARAEHRREALQKGFEALSYEVASQVRAAHARAKSAAQASEFASSVLLPQVRRRVELARRAFELGDASVLTLLEAQELAIQAEQADLEARLELARARLELQRTVGSPLDSGDPRNGTLASPRESGSAR